MAAGAKPWPGLMRRRPRPWALLAAAALTCLLPLWLCGASWEGEALVLRRGRRGQKAAEDADKAEARRAEASEDSEAEGPELLEVRLVELQLENQPWHMVKVLVPIWPQVAKWWTEEKVDIVARVDPRITGRPQVKLQMVGENPLQLGEAEVQGVQATVELPEGAVLPDVDIRWVRVTAAFDPLAELGPIRALLVACPVRTPGGSPMMTARSALSGRHPLRWLLLPWLLLLLPFVAGSSVGPVALLAGACLTLASIACLSFVIAVLIVLVQRRCVLCTRRWRRLWRFRSLARRCSRISAAYGETGPCCICLAEADEREKLIALLPCKHAMHEECYSSWVGADAYPSHDLICPLCRRRAEGIGKLACP